MQDSLFNSGPAWDRVSENERLIQAVFLHAGVGIGQLDISGRWMRANPKLIEMLGYSDSELMEKNLLDLACPQDRAHMRLTLYNLQAGALEFHSDEYRLLRKPGDTVWVHLRLAAERGATDVQDDWLIVVMEDIEARKAAERILRDQEEFLQSIYAGVDEAIFVVEPGPGTDFTFLDCNPAYARLVSELGVDVASLVGVRLGAFPASAQEGPFAHLRAGCAECAATGLPVEFEGSLTFAGRTSHWFNQLSPLKDATGRTYRIVGTSVNVTGQKQSAEKIRATEEILRQAQKMEAVGRLAGGIAHDFNNLLTAINGYGDLLLGRIPPATREHDFALEIRKAGDRAANLTQQLLAFSRKQVLSIRDVDLNAVVTDMAKMLQRLIGENITLITKLDGRLGPIQADAGQIEQVILNLCINARDAMPDGGELSLATESKELDAGSFGPEKPLAPGAYAVMTVSDTGIGMDKETQARIFEPFFTTKATGKGTGLGMSTVYGIVQQTGGDIRVSSEPGRGTVFRVYLPAAKGRQRRRVAKPKIVGQALPRDGAETVLVVEDEDSLRRLIADVLSGAGYRVLTAANGIEALQMVGQSAADIDLVVTDLVMSGMGGRELTEKLTALAIHPRLLYISGYTDDTVVREGIRVAEMEFLQKPFTAAALLQRIRRMLDAPAPFPDSQPPPDSDSVG